MGGFLAAMFAGGLFSAVFGQPFSGQTGLRVFSTGMLIPGLVPLAPIGAIIGLSIGRSRSAKRIDED